MTEKSQTYTLWTIPLSEWSTPFSGVKLTEADEQDLIDFAKSLDNERLNERLRPFDTPVTTETLNNSVGCK